ncbi:MAG: hypothetical protein VX777_03745 [Chlamydiota bacterium]|nr:hypothetical protein [Chlamydiota bacterium]
MGFNPNVRSTRPTAVVTGQGVQQIPGADRRNPDRRSHDTVVEVSRRALPQREVVVVVETRNGRNISQRVPGNTRNVPCPNVPLSQQNNSLAGRNINSGPVRPNVRRTDRR